MLTHKDNSMLDLRPDNMMALLTPHDIIYYICDNLGHKLY